MKKFLIGLVEAVQRPFAPVPCGVFRVARYPQWRSTSKTAIESPAFADHTFNCPPSLLLPAPARGAAASFYMTTSAPDLGRLRHLATRLMSSSASNAERSTTAREDADARYSERLDTLRRLAGLGSKACLKCKNTYELYCFPADRCSPDGRFHYCCACKADVRRQNNAPVGWSVVAPGDRCQQCSGCGVVRPLAWYYVDNARMSGRGACCRLCKAIKNRQTSERNQRELESQDPVIKKRCSGCVKTLPAASFRKKSSSRDGYDSCCRVCDKTRKFPRDLERIERWRDQTLVVADVTERVCLKCRIRKPWAEFERHASYMCGVRSVCKRCRLDMRQLTRLKANAGL